MARSPAGRSLELDRIWNKPWLRNGGNLWLLATVFLDLVVLSVTREIAKAETSVPAVPFFAVGALATSLAFAVWMIDLLFQLSRRRPEPEPPEYMSTRNAFAAAISPLVDNSPACPPRTPPPADPRPKEMDELDLTAGDCRKAQLLLVAAHLTFIVGLMVVAGAERAGRERMWELRYYLLIVGACGLLLALRAAAVDADRLRYRGTPGEYIRAPGDAARVRTWAVALLVVFASTLCLCAPWVRDIGRQRRVASVLDRHARYDVHFVRLRLKQKPAGQSDAEAWPLLRHRFRPSTRIDTDDTGALTAIVGDGWRADAPAFEVSGPTITARNDPRFVLVPVGVALLALACVICLVRLICGERLVDALAFRRTPSGG